MKKHNSPLSQSRRDFVKKTTLGASALALSSELLARTSDWQETGMPTRPLGNTGERVSIICLGGWHIGAVEDKQEAIRLMHMAIDEGMTFFDNAWDYHNGGSELIMGEALKDGKRKDVFLMTKNCNRDYKGSMENLEESLKRMQTDYIDLWQFHEMVYDNDPDWVFEKGGMKAALEAQKAGKVRYIGFTGHKDPSIHLKMINKPYEWASAQMPINIMDAHYRSFQKNVVPVCLEKGIGVIGMKSLGGGGGAMSGIIPNSTGIAAEDCIRYALSQPVSSLVCGIRTMDELKQDIAIARGFKAMAKERQEELVNSVKDVAGDGRYELFKSSKNFDGPYHRKQHGFSVG
jgi:predicted aldo/keto reductase-like oxidoreductase